MANKLLTLNPELWLPISDYENLYEVSDFGRVQSLDRLVRSSANPNLLVPRRGRILKQGKLNKGHRYVRLSRNGVVELRLVHHLVLEAFVGPRPNGLQGLHFDDVPANNHRGNLRWGTPSENGHDSVRNGTNYFANKTHCPQRHEYTPENTYVNKQGRRVCRQCRNDKSRVYYLKSIASGKGTYARRQRRKAVSV